jgi:hypothetical protein
MEDERALVSIMSIHRLECRPDAEVRRDHVGEQCALGEVGGAGDGGGVVGDRMR